MIAGLLRAHLHRAAGAEGGVGTLRVFTAAYNEELRERTNTPTNYPVHVRGDRRLLDNRDGTLVKTERLRASIAAAELPGAVVPTTTSELIVAGVTYTVVDVEVVAPGGTLAVSYELELQAAG